MNRFLFKSRKVTLTIVGGGYVVRNLVSGLAALAGKKMFDDQRHVGQLGDQVVRFLIYVLTDLTPCLNLD